MPSVMLLLTLTVVQVGPAEEGVHVQLQKLGARVERTPRGQLRDVDLSRTAVNDHDLDNLSLLSELRSLNLASTRVSDAGMDSLRGLRLEVLHLPAHITRRGCVSALAGSNIKELHLRGTHLSASDLRGWLNHLEVLDLADATHFGDDGVHMLRSFTEVIEGGTLRSESCVRRLDLSGTRVTDAGLRHMLGPDGLVRLEELHLANTDISDAGLAALKGLPQLRMLDLGNSVTVQGTVVAGVRVTAEGVANFRKARPHCLVRYTSTKLESLTAAQAGQIRALARVGRLELNGDGQIVSFTLRAGKELTVVDHEALLGLRQLRRVDLHAAGTQRFGFGWLNGTRDWTHLDLSQCQLQDVDLLNLRGLRQLEVLDLSGTAITDAGLARLHRFERLASLNVRGTKALVSGLRSFQKALPLTLINYDPWTAVGLAEGMNVRLNGRFELIELALGRDSDDQVLLGILESHSAIETLYLNHSAVGNASMANLVQLAPQLRLLDLGNTRIGNAGLKHVASMKRLQVLNLWSTSLDDVGLAHLKALPLRELNLSETAVSDAGLEAIVGLTELRRLNLENTRVTQRGVRRLQLSLPGCAIEK
ncbi:MAG: hypothetical protein AB7K24_18190 [Gemmataceae bacterium]